MGRNQEADVFACFSPECDRSFTRSDALAKHMRTVHETEALRPSDPVPKSHPHPYHGHPSSYTNPSAAAAASSLALDPVPGAHWAPEDGFDPDEERLAPRELLRLLKQKQGWAEQEQEELRETLEMLEKRRRDAWVKKEVLLDRVLRQELGEEEARGASLDFE